MLAFDNLGKAVAINERNGISITSVNFRGITYFATPTAPRKGARPMRKVSAERKRLLPNMVPTAYLPKSIICFTFCRVECFIKVVPSHFLTKLKSDDSRLEAIFAQIIQMTSSFNQNRFIIKKITKLTMFTILKTRILPKACHDWSMDTALFQNKFEKANRG